MKAIDAYLTKLFRNFPSSKEAKALKVRLYYDATEKFEELCKEGWTAEQAEQRIIDEIGSEQELEGILPRTNATLVLTFKAMLIICLLSFTMLIAYYAYFIQQEIMSFDSTLRILAVLAITPIAYISLGYLLGCVAAKYCNKHLSHTVRVFLSILGSIFIFIYLVLLCFYFASSYWAGYALYFIQKDQYLFLIFGFGLGMGVNH